MFSGLLFAFGCLFIVIQLLQKSGPGDYGQAAMFGLLLWVSAAIVWLAGG